MKDGINWVTGILEMTKYCPLHRCHVLSIWNSASQHTAGGTRYRLQSDRNDNCHFPLHPDLAGLWTPCQGCWQPAKAKGMEINVFWYLSSPNITRIVLRYSSVESLPRVWSSGARNVAVDFCKNVFFGVTGWWREEGISIGYGDGLWVGTLSDIWASSFWGVSDW